MQFLSRQRVVSILLYGCSTWTLTKRAGEKARRQLHKNAASNIDRPGGNNPTKHQLYDHLPPITKTIKVRQTRHAGHCWRSRDELISDVLLWTPLIWLSRSRTTSTNLHTATLRVYGM